MCQTEGENTKRTLKALKVLFPWPVSTLGAREGRGTSGLRPRASVAVERMLFWLSHGRPVAGRAQQTRQTPPLQARDAEKHTTGDPDRLGRLTLCSSLYSLAGLRLFCLLQRTGLLPTALEN